MTTHPFGKTISAVGLLIVGLILTMPSGAAYGESVGDPPAARALENAVRPGAAPGAMFAFRDPLTGEMRHHTPSELDAMRVRLEAIFNHSADGLEQVTLPDGSVMVDLEGRFIHGAVAAVDADGNVVVKCMGDAGQIVGLAASVVPPPAQEPANPVAAD